MVRRVWQICFELGLILFGIILVSATSALFEGQTFSLHRFFVVLMDVGEELLTPQAIIYENPSSGVERSLFPIIFLAYWSSIRIFFLALVISILLSTILLIGYYSLGEYFRKGIQKVGFLIGSLPDLFVIALFQLGIVWYFKQTGILILDVASVGENQVILLPAITLCILPTFFFFTNMIVFLKDEEGKPYIELAKSKGLGRFTILFSHTIRNVLISLTYHGKQIVWMMLSNLLVLEYLFNVFGVTSFLFSYNQPSIFAITSILLFIPLYLVLKSLQALIGKKIGKEMSL
jgi:peptide/nickel transport system permease protein